LESVVEQVGSYEAKTHLPKLLERVAKGARITITKHGVPVAILVPAGVRRTGPADEVVADLRRFREGKRLGGVKLKDMIEEGRR
jgi:prevent-host-death family protein